MVTDKGLRLVSMVVLLSAASLAAGDLRLADAKTRDGDTAAARTSPKKRADVDTAQGKSATLLAAAYRDDLEAARRLVAAGANVNEADDYGVTSLFLACANGSSGMVEELLKAGADPNAADWSGVAPLMMCARTGNLDTVKLLLARGAKVNSAETRQEQTALMWAAAEKHPDMVQALIERSADVNAHTKGGFTALMFAAQQGDLDSARALLAAGADINAATNDQSTWIGETPLLIASFSGHEALAEFLLDKGADPNAADDFGFTAIHFALIQGLADVSGVRLEPFLRQTYLFRPDMVGLVKALLAHGANPNARIKKRWGGNMFLSVPLNDPSKFSVSEVGATPFLLAAKVLDVDMMRLLVAAGADPNLATENGTTPLMTAAGLIRVRNHGSVPLNQEKEQEKKALEAVKLCVELGADVNAANDLGLTALHGAAFSGSNDVIQFLVEKGAKLDPRDLSGQTPLDKAMVIKPKTGVPTHGSGYDVFTPYIYDKSTVALLRQLGAQQGSTAVSSARVAPGSEQGAAPAVQ